MRSTHLIVRSDMENWVDRLLAVPEAHDLEAQGYRRISNRHCLLSRLDRPDWVDHLPLQLQRSTAEMEDFYRRNISKDKITVRTNVSRLVASSSGTVEPIGYLEKGE